MKIVKINKIIIKWVGPNMKHRMPQPLDHEWLFNHLINPKIYKNVESKMKKRKKLKSKYGNEAYENWTHDWWEMN